MMRWAVFSPSDRRIACVWASRGRRSYGAVWALRGLSGKEGVTSFIGGYWGTAAPNSGCCFAYFARFHQELDTACTLSSLGTRVTQGFVRRDRLERGPQHGPLAFFRKTQAFGYHFTS